MEGCCFSDVATGRLKPEKVSSPRPSGKVDCEQFKESDLQGKPLAQTEA